MKKHLLVLLLLCVSQFAFSQAALPSSLLEILAKDSSRRATDRSLAHLMGLPLLMQQNGEVAEFQFFDTQGQPIYYICDNLDAAKTLSTNKLWLNGGLGLNLSGDSMFIGVWDGGKVRESHVELVNRATQLDGASTLSNHATHVSGTIAAAGVKASAKGMAYKAQVRAYDWNLDELEMSQAASNGMLVSNHSYGYIAGWYNNTDKDRWEWYGDILVSSTEDFKYGYYDNQAQDWDEIANANPYYLIVKSAGNDRGKKLPASETSHWVYNRNTGQFSLSSTPRPATGPYDCIPGAGVSKNILTVGAVNAIPAGYSQTSDVVMSGFSGWGPTDDGRIKPDVVGNGVGVNSSIASGDNAYASYNGTSMAAPNVSGSLLLWQEHHRKLNGNYMKAATLKGLAIHTADEAGANPGPDYSFGWGLVNSAKAVQLLSNAGSSDQIHELALANQAHYERVVYSDGTTPLYTTLCWNDPAASPSTQILNDTTPRLVHDLDIRLIRLDDQSVFEPWILDPANPANAATTGDNRRDNVEQVKIASPQAGYYRIVVSHKGNLSKTQDFALLISGLQPKVKAEALVPSGTVCTNYGLALQFTGYGDPQEVRWTFFGPDTLVVLGNPAQVKFNKPGTYALQQWVKGSYNEDSVFINAAYQVNPSPDAVISSLGGEQFCSNDTITRILSGSANMVFTGGGVDQQTWKASATAVGENFIFGQVNGANGCISRDSLRLEILAAPAIPLISLEADSQLKSSAASGNYWLFNGQYLPTDTLPFVRPKYSGFYSVEVRAANGCSSQSSLYPYYFTFTSKVDELGLSVYPNPSSGLVQVEISEAGPHTLRVMDMQGKILLTKPLETKLELNLNGLANSSYLIQVDQGVPQKLILNR